jgi:hypothetical protein
MHGLSIALLQGIEKSAFLLLWIGPNPNPCSAQLLHVKVVEYTDSMFPDNALGIRYVCSSEPKMTQIAKLLVV